MSDVPDDVFDHGEFPEIDDTTPEEMAEQRKRVKSYLDEKYKGEPMPLVPNLNPNTVGIMRPQMTPQQYGVVPGLLGANLCNTCGAVVLGQDVHDEWHFRLSQVRGLLS